MQLLESLLEEDDSAPDVWYLLAMCLHGGCELEDALDAVQRGHAAATAAGLPTTDSQWNFEELKVCVLTYSQSNCTAAVHVCGACVKD